MKVLLSGHHNPHFSTITEYIEAAIRVLGHDLSIFEDRKHIIPGRVREKLLWLEEFDLKYINRSFLSLAEKMKPDIVIVTGGHRINRASVTKLKQNGICAALWTIDAPLKFQPIIDSAFAYDWIFCQGTEAVELLEKAGCREAIWLPMACDPELHRAVSLSPEEKHKYGSDVVFVGSYYPSRAEILEGVSDFDLGIWGPGWNRIKNGPLGKCVRDLHVSPKEWRKIYSASKIVLAPHYQYLEGTIRVNQASPRVFEALACGAFVISDDQTDVFSLFEEGKHLTKYKDASDLAEKISFYLARPTEREKIADRGKKEVLRRHTYVDRVKYIISTIRLGKTENGQRKNRSYR